MYLHTRQKDDLHIKNGPTFDLGSKGRVHYQQVVVYWFCHRLTYTDNTIGVTRKPEQEAGFIVFRLPLVRAAIIITHAPWGDES